MIQTITIKELDAKEIPEALDLVWQVFMAYEAPDYTNEGVEEFYKSIHDVRYLAQLQIFGAFAADKLVGVIASRCAGSHIALFFVDGAYQRQSIGRRLLEALLELCSSDTMTVNSSPYAVSIYHKLGFYDTDQEQVINGLRFTPMARKV